MRKLTGRIFPQKQKDVAERITAKLLAENWLSATETSYSQEQTFLLDQIILFIFPRNE